jgi:hypothetical protein
MPDGEVDAVLRVTFPSSMAVLVAKTAIREAGHSAEVIQGGLGGPAVLRLRTRPERVADVEAIVAGYPQAAVDRVG